MTLGLRELTSCKGLIASTVQSAGKTTRGGRTWPFLFLFFCVFFRKNASTVQSAGKTRGGRTWPQNALSLCVGKFLASYGGFSFVSPVGTYEKPQSVGLTV